MGRNGHGQRASGASGTTGATGPSSIAVAPLGEPAACCMVRRSDGRASTGGVFAPCRTKAPIAPTQPILYKRKTPRLTGGPTVDAMTAQRAGLIITIATLAVCAPANADCSDPFAAPGELLDLHLRLTTQSWQRLTESERSSSTCEGQYPYFDAQFRCGESEEWITIGVRRRRDRSETLQKLPLKLDFNRVVMGQRWPAARGELGFRRLSLNSGQPDDGGGEGSNGPGSNTGVLSALLTEHLAWQLMQEEIPWVGNVGYARLTLHFDDTGQSRHQGVYILIEDIDRTAVRARFGADRGALFKTTDPECIEEVVFDDGPPNAATGAFETWLGLDPDDFPQTWYARTNEVMFIDELFRQEALRELFANTADTILGAMNNYFALDLYDARRIYFPWDLDDVFRPQPQIRAVDEPLVSSCTGGGWPCAPIPIGVNTRDEPELRRTYLEILCRLTNGVGEENKVVAQLEQLDALVRPLVAEELPLLWQSEGLDPLDASTPGTYAAEVERMRTWIPGRVRAVRSMIQAQGVACPAGCEEAATASCDFAGCPSRRTCTDGRWGPCEPTGVPAGTLDADCDGNADFPVASDANGGVASPTPASGGCACRAAPTRSRTSGALFLALLCVVATRLRARRRHGVRK